MATTTVALNVPAGDGSGTPSSTRRFGELKTIVVGGTFKGVVRVEAAGGGGYCEVATFTAPDARVVRVSAQTMRVTLEDYISGTPEVSIISEITSTRSVALDVPVGPGVGASSNVTTLGPVITTFISSGGGSFSGTLALEVSSDNITFEQLGKSFTSFGCRTLEAPEAFVRVRRTDPGGTPPLIHISASDPEGNDNGPNTVVVRSPEDFPEPDGTGRRQLVDDTLYLIRGTIDLEDTYVQSGSNTSIVGFATSPASTLINNRVDFLVRGSSLEMRSLTLRCPNGTAYVADTAARTYLENVAFNECSQAARFVANTQLVIDHIFLLNNDTGIEFAGTIDAAQIDGIIDESTVLNYRGLIIDAAAVLGPFNIGGGLWILNDASQTAMDLDPGATLNGVVFIHDNEMVLGGATALGGGVTEGTPSYRFKDNNEIDDSRFIGAVGFTGNTTQNTIITVAGQWEPVGSGNPSHPPYTIQPVSQRFSLQGAVPNQVLQYDGVDNIIVKCTYTLGIAKIGGATINVRARLLENGVPVVGSEASVDITSSVAIITQTIPFAMNNGDELQIEIANFTDTSDLQVNSAELVVNRIV